MGLGLTPRFFVDTDQTKYGASQALRDHWARRGFPHQARPGSNRLRLAVPNTPGFAAEVRIEGHKGGSRVRVRIRHTRLMRIAYSAFFTALLAGLVMAFFVPGWKLQAPNLFILIWGTAFLVLGFVVMRVSLHAAAARLRPEVHAALGVTESSPKTA